MKKILRLHTFCALFLILSPCLSLSLGAEANETKTFVSMRVFSVSPCRQLVLKSGSPDSSIAISDQTGRVLARGQRLTLTQNAEMIVVNGVSCQGVVKASGRVLLESGRVQRHASDGVSILAGSQGLEVIVRLSFEEYFAGVLAAESAPWSGLAPRRAASYLAAQAVAIRSYALYYAHRGRHGLAMFCDSTHCQAWRDPTGNAPILRAVRQTSGQVLCLGNQIAPAFYASTMGDRSVLPSEVWGDSALDHFFRRVTAVLPGEQKSLASDSPHFRWSWRVSERGLTEILAGAFGFVWDGSAIRVERTQGGIVCRIYFGNEAVKAEDFRLAFCRATHWGSLRSLSFTVKRQAGKIVFEGMGLGHGVGMCQYGALALAQRGWDWRRILAWYYPALRVDSCASTQIMGR
jgi:stage II sporulation protein D